jgi:hypothetical protein
MQKSALVHILGIRRQAEQLASIPSTNIWSTRANNK